MKTRQELVRAVEEADDAMRFVFGSPWDYQKTARGRASARDVYTDAKDALAAYDNVNI